MGILLFLSNGLLALGPVISLLAQNIFSHPARTVIMVFGAFFYFCALVASGTLFTISKAVGFSSNYIAVFVVISIVLQELARYVSYIVMKKVRPTFQFLNDEERNSVSSTQGSAISMGTGFALAAAMYGSINTLVLSLQPGVPGINAMDPGSPIPHSSQLFVTRSLEASACSLLNLFWTMIMFNALDSQRPASQKNKWLGLILATHLLNTLVSLISYNRNTSLVWISIAVAWFLVLATGSATWYMFGGSKSTLQAALSSRNQRISGNPQSEFQSSLSRDHNE